MFEREEDYMDMTYKGVRFLDMSRNELFEAKTDIQETLTPQTEWKTITR